MTRASRGEGGVECATARDGVLRREVESRGLDDASEPSTEPLSAAKSFLMLRSGGVLVPETAPLVCQQLYSKGCIARPREDRCKRASLCHPGMGPETVRDLCRPQCWDES